MAKMKNRVNALLFQRLVPHYRVPIFRQLFEKLNIIVCHSKEKKSSSLLSFHNQMEYPNELISRIYLFNKDTSVVQNVLFPLLKYRPKVVISEFAVCYLSFWILFLFRPFFKYRLVAWTHLKDEEILTPFKSIRSKIELLFYRSVDGLIFYSPARKDIVSKRLKNDTHLFTAHNTIDTSQFLALRDAFEKIGRDKIKKELRLKEKYHLIYVGRLIKDKRMDLLLDAFKQLQHMFDVALHIIGQGPESKIVQDYSHKLPSLYYYGAVFDNNLTEKLLYISDLIINPGRVGLSIVHAFCFGTPMITCRTTAQGPFHSPEIEYLKHEINGLFCDSTADSVAQNVMRLLEDERLLRQMSISAFESAVKDCSVERMVEGFEELIERMSGN